MSKIVETVQILQFIWHYIDLVVKSEIVWPNRYIVNLQKRATVKRVISQFYYY